MDEKKPDTIVHIVNNARLYAALAKAQAVMGNAVKDSTNPHFKAKYADLASVWAACRGALTANGLSVIQMTEGDNEAVIVTTMLCHESGESVSSTLSIKPAQSTAHGMGSAITYARRYALAAMVGVTPDDDDGNAATHGATNTQHVTPPSPPVTPEKPVVVDPSSGKGFEKFCAEAQKAEKIDELTNIWHRFERVRNRYTDAHVAKLKDICGKRKNALSKDPELL